LGSHATDSCFSGLAVEDFGSGEGPDSNAEPKWKKITGIITGVVPNTYALPLGMAEEVKATVMFTNGGIFGTKNSVDVMINDIQSVSWEPVDSNNKIKLGGNTTANGGGQRCFPEKDSPNGGVNNEINVKVTLSQNVFTNVTSGTVTVHVDWFDPDNPVKSTLLPTPTHNKQGKRDNSGTIANFNSKTLTFTYPHNQVVTKWLISNAYAGDNHIVAAHPNAGVIAKYEFATANAPNGIFAGRTLMYPKPSGGFEKLPGNMQTEMLTVWRTLWIERKQMANPTEGLGTNQFNPATKYSGSGSFVGKQWMDGNEDTMPANEPSDFDVKFQPPLPDLTRTVEQFARVCIVVESVSNDQIKQWANVSNATQPNFIKNLDSNGVTATQVGRDVPATSNANTFWIIHALGAYDPALSKDFDGEDDWLCGHATSVSALIYNELIRDLINTAEWTSTTKPPWASSYKPPFIGIPEARARVVLHEILHYFLGNHGTSVSDSGIMNTNTDAQNCSLYTSGTHELDDEQIRKIQSQSKPTSP